MKKIAIIAIILLSMNAGAAESAAPTYVPIDEALWTKAVAMKTAKDAKGYLNVCRLAYKKNFKTIEGAEARMLCSDALIAAGFPTAASSLTLELIQRHPGSRPTAFAVLGIEAAAHDSLIDATEWESAVQNLVLPEATPAVQSMVEYFRVLRLSKLKYPEWQKKAFEQIDASSYWGARLQFYDAINSFKDGQIDKALTAFEDILKIPNLPEHFAQTVKLQLARLYFEKKDLDKADELYKTYANGSRDYGRALLERAWIEFHRKQYSTSLGLLTVLKSTFFNGMRDPERYLLSVLIYRELCHFDDIKEINKDFEAEYKPMLDAVNARKPLQSDPTLLGMTLAFGRLQEAADLVFQIRNEMAAWKDLARANPFDEMITKLYAKKEADLRIRTEFDNRQLLRLQAENILRVKDQLQLVEYVSDLEKLRPRNAFTHKFYEAEQEGNANYEKLYWPHHKEIWWGEINGYRVLINDKCLERKPAKEGGR